MYVPGVPPPGGDQNKAPMLRAVIGSELTLATIIVLLRFYTRLKITRSPGVEDYIMLGTFVRSLSLIRTPRRDSLALAHEQRIEAYT